MMDCLTESSDRLGSYLAVGSAGKLSGIFSRGSFDISSVCVRVCGCLCLNLSELPRGLLL